MHTHTHTHTHTHHHHGEESLTLTTCFSLARSLSVCLSACVHVCAPVTAEEGRKQIELAEVEMPGLMATRAEYADQPLKGARVMGEEKTNPCIRCIALWGWCPRGCVYRFRGGGRGV